MKPSDRDFPTERDPGDLDPTPSSARGGHEGGGRAPWARPLPRGFLVCCLTSTPSPPDEICSKNNAPEGFIPFGLRLIFLFFETLK